MAGPLEMVYLAYVALYRWCAMGKTARSGAEKQAKAVRTAWKEPSSAGRSACLQRRHGELRQQKTPADPPGARLPGHGMLQTGKLPNPHPTNEKTR